MTLQKPDKNCGGYSLVAIGERMVLHDEIQQISRLLFNAGIQLRTIESLVYSLQRTLEGIILLISEAE